MLLILHSEIWPVNVFIHCYHLTIWKADHLTVVNLFWIAAKFCRHIVLQSCWYFSVIRNSYRRQRRRVLVFCYIRNLDIIGPVCWRFVAGHFVVDIFGLCFDPGQDFVGSSLDNLVNIEARILNWIFVKHNFSLKILHRNPRKNMFEIKFVPSFNFSTVKRFQNLSVN